MFFTLKQREQKGSSEIWSDKYIGIKVNSLCFKEVKPCFLGDKPNISKETKLYVLEFRVLLFRFVILMLSRPNPHTFTFVSACFRYLYYLFMVFSLCALYIATLYTKGYIDSSLLRRQNVLKSR